MKIQLHIHETTISVERESDDLNIDDMFQVFKTLLIGASFEQETINDWILEKSQQLSTNKNKRR
jgi:hypothetical protein